MPILTLVKAVKAIKAIRKSKKAKRARKQYDAEQQKSSLAHPNDQQQLSLPYDDAQDLKPPEYSPYPPQKDLISVGCVVNNHDSRQQHFGGRQTGMRDYFDENYRAQQPLQQDSYGYGYGYGD